MGQRTRREGGRQGWGTVEENGGQGEGREGEGPNVMDSNLSPP